MLHAIRTSSSICYNEVVNIQHLLRYYRVLWREPRNTNPTAPVPPSHGLGACSAAGPRNLPACQEKVSHRAGKEIDARATTAKKQSGDVASLFLLDDSACKASKPANYNQYFLEASSSSWICTTCM